MEKLDTNWWSDKHTLDEKENTYTKTSVYVNGNDGYKQHVNGSQTSNKHKAIAALKLCHYRTPPKEVARLLEALFVNHQSEEGHWLYIAQRWNPRAINRVISLMTKQHRRGDTTIQKPAAYFTFLIKKRKQRRTFTSINDTRKQQSSQP